MGSRSIRSMPDRVDAPPKKINVYHQPAHIGRRSRKEIGGSHQ